MINCLFHAGPFVEPVFTETSVDMDIPVIKANAAGIAENLVRQLCHFKGAHTGHNDVSRKAVKVITVGSTADVLVMLIRPKAAVDRDRTIAAGAPECLQLFPKVAVHKADGGPVFTCKLADFKMFANFYVFFRAGVIYVTADHLRRLPSLAKYQWLFR